MTSQSSSPNPSPEIHQDLKGDRNQAIGSMSGNAKAIANVETYIENQIHQPLPRQLSLHQLPNDITDFTGRDTELQQLTQLLQPHTDRTAVVISAVVGMAGIGKSALAIHIAHQLIPQFPDAQLYINLRGADDSPLEPFAVLGQWLRAFGLEDSTLPTDLPGRVSAYRSLLAQKRAIVLLDNASSEAQVRDMIPGSSTCAVIITSRRRLTALAGAEVVDLSVMPTAEALDLLQRLIGADRIQAEVDAAAQIVQLCGLLPLAIRIAGGTLKQKRHWSLATYAAKLGEQQQRLAQLHLSDLDVRSSFQLSYGELTETDAHLFQFLGLLPRDFATPAAAALIDQEPEATAAALERLVETQLLEAVSEDRYQFHDLIRLFAQEQLDREQPTEYQQTAQQRLVQWYWEQADFWENVFDPVRRRQLIEALQSEQDSDLSTAELEQNALLAGLSWFELERINLLMVVAWANRLQAWFQVVSFAANLVPFFSIRGYWSDWITTHEFALAAAWQTGDQQNVAKTIANLGEAYRQQGRWAEAIECFQQSQPIFHALGDQQNVAKTIANLGLVYLQQGRWAEAIECFQQSQPIFHALGDQQNVAKTIANLSEAYRQQGRWAEAIECFQQSQPIFHALGDQQNVAKTIMNLGLVYLQQGRWAEAIECFQQSQPIFHALGDQQSEGLTIMNLGEAYRRQGRWAEAIECFQQSQPIFHALGDQQNVAKTIANLGLVYLQQGCWAEAIECFQQSQPIFHALGDQQSEGLTIMNLGVVDLQQGRWAEAIECFQQSQPIFHALGDQQSEGLTIMNLGVVYTQQNKPERAIAHWQEALTKLHPDSPEAQQVMQWLAPPTSPSRQQILFGCLIWLAIIAFIIFNLWRGHWLIALAVAFLFAGFIAFHLWRSRRGKQTP